MAKKASEFERDKARFLSLLREVLTRIQEVQDEGSVGDFRPLVDEINELELATKHGFRSSPLIFGERSQPQYEYVRFLIWNDPYGTTCGECWLSAPVRVWGEKVDAVGRRSKATDRKRLAGVVRRWIRAVQGLQEPDTYPAIPHILHKDAPPRLWADPLWRELHKTIGWLRQDQQVLWERPYHDGFGWNVMQLNRLARESGLTGGVIFRWDGSHLSIHDSKGSRLAALSIGSGDRIKKPERIVLRQVVACLEDWQKAREVQVLRPAAADPESAEPLGSDGQLAGESPLALAKNVGKRRQWNYEALKRFLRMELKKKPSLTESELASLVASQTGASFKSARAAVQRAGWRKLSPAQRSIS